MSLPSEPEKDQHDPQPDKPAQPPAEPAVKPAAGWVERLAERSTGLPEYEKRSEPESDKGDHGLWRLAGLGLQFAATVALFAWMGNALDHRMGWSPWGLVILSLLAVIGNLYLLIKETLKQDTIKKDTPAGKGGNKNVSSRAGKRSDPTSGPGPGG
jgi:F0F1-type ATP synthase assembly protein I